MKTLTPKEGVQILAVDLPEDANNIRIGEFSGDLIYESKHGVAYHVELPKGKFSELGFSDEITEEQAKELVESQYYSGVGFRYFMYDREWDFVAVTALHSFASFIRSQGITNRTYLLKLIK